MKFVSGLLAALVSLTVASPAIAAPVAPDLAMGVVNVSVVQSPSGGLTPAAVFTLRNSYGQVAPTGTTVQMQAWSCGQFVKAATVTASGDADVTLFFSDSPVYDYTPNRYNVMIGEALQYKLVITEPGFDPYTYSRNLVLPNPVARCADILAADVAEPLLVKKWSKKLTVRGTTKAFAGSRVKVSATRSNGEARYQWRVGNRVLGKTRALKLTNKHVGSKLVLSVVVSKLGGPDQVKYVRYGRIRNSR